MPTSQFKQLTDISLAESISKLKERYIIDQRCFYLLTNLNKNIEQMNILSFKDILTYYDTSCVKDNQKILVSLDCWIKSRGFSRNCAYTIINEFLLDNISYLNLSTSEELLVLIGTNKYCYSNLTAIGYIPFYSIYDINKSIKSIEKNVTSQSNYYIQLMHINAIELIYITYSKCTKLDLINDEDFLNIWYEYLNLIQENAKKENLEKLHIMFWSNMYPSLLY